jgi:uncharacterized protein
MQLTEHRASEHYSVLSVADHGITLQYQNQISHHNGTLIIGAHLLDTDWPVVDIAYLDTLDESLLAPLIEPQPEVVILGCGSRQPLPNPALMQWFYRRHVGLEIMTLDAACRTFNVLMSEQRRALAALILPPAHHLG